MALPSFTSQVPPFLQGFGSHGFKGRGFVVSGTEVGFGPIFQKKTKNFNNSGSLMNLTTVIPPIRFHLLILNVMYKFQS